MENKYSCGHKGCPLNHMCRKIHQAAFGTADNTTPRGPTSTTATNNNHHRRTTATAAAGESPPVTVRVIDIQSKPPPPQPPQAQLHHRAAAVSFKPPAYGDDHQRSGVHVEDRFSDYIGRVRKKLRTLSTVGGGGGDHNRYGNYDKRNSGVGKDSKFSDYISQVKNKFTRTTTTAANTATSTTYAAGAKTKNKSWIKY